MPAVTIDPNHIRLVPPFLLGRFVAAYEPELRRRGLDIADPLHLLTMVTPDILPPDMVDALQRIEDLSDEAAVDILLDMSHGALAHGATDLDPRGLAMLAWLEHRTAFEAAHSRRRVETVQRFREFAGRERLTPRVIRDEELTGLASAFGAQFAARGRTSICAIERVSEHRTIGFRITHGRPLRREAALEVKADGPMLVCETPIQYRPPQHDLVIYDPRLGRLKVNAPDAATFTMYREGFGRLLFGDEEWFGTKPVVSLGPIVELGSDCLIPTEGIKKVELTAIKVTLPGDLRPALFLEAVDVFKALELYRPVDLHDGMLVHARLRITYASGGRPRSVNIRPPFQVKYDRRRDDAVTRAYLEERGFLSVRQPVWSAK